MVILFLLFTSPYFQNVDPWAWVHYVINKKEIKAGVLQIGYCFNLFIVFRKERIHPLLLLGDFAVAPSRASTAYRPDPLTLDWTM